MGIEKKTRRMLQRELIQWISVNSYIDQASHVIIIPPPKQWTTGISVKFLSCSIKECIETKNNINLALQETHKRIGAENKLTTNKPWQL